ncbi:MAG: hypothetical protein IKB89_04670, partial [Clostridia bacterium]|nr:hypothetical protein [Clostridia bacterium]
KSSIGAFVAGIAMLALVIFVPFLWSLFEIAALSSDNLLAILGLAFAPTVVIQIVKIIRNK